MDLMNEGFRVDVSTLRMVVPSKKSPCQEHPRGISHEIGLQGGVGEAEARFVDASEYGVDSV